LFAFAGASAVQVDPTQPKDLDAGPQLTVNGPNGVMTLPKNSTGGGYSALLGGGSPGGGFPGFMTHPHAAAGSPLYLSPGDYTVTGPGGADVGPFTAKITIAQPLTWTNKDSVNTVVRSNGQLVTWSGGDPNSIVEISGSSIELGTNPDGSDTVGGFFTCYAKDSDLQFDIPAVVLDFLPPSTSNPAIPIPTGSLSLGTNQSNSFTATGLDKGFISSTVTDGKSVTYQ